MSRLVYTSTYNVVFAGQEIINGDHLEILPDNKVSFKSKLSTSNDHTRVSAHRVYWYASNVFCSIAFSMWITTRGLKPLLSSW